MVRLPVVRMRNNYTPRLSRTMKSNQSSYGLDARRSSCIQIATSRSNQVTQQKHVVGSSRSTCSKLIEHSGGLRPIQRLNATAAS